MKRLVEWAGVAGLIIAFLVLLYGDNWLGWHPDKQNLENENGPPLTTETSIAPSDKKPTSSSMVPSLMPAPVIHNVVISPVSTSTPTPSPPSVEDTSDDFSVIVRQSNRSVVKSRATFACHREVTRLSSGLSALIFRASIAQNQFFNTSSSKAMIADLNRWLPEARKFLIDNKNKLTDTSVFDLANPTGGYGTFHRDGNKAWATMDAKRKALEAISHEVEARPCDKIGKAAVAECDETSNCQIPD